MKTFLTDIYTHDTGHPSEVTLVCNLRLIDCHKPQAYVRNVEDILSLTIVTSNSICTIYPLSQSKDTCVFTKSISLEELEGIEYLGVNTLTSSVSLEYFPEGTHLAYPILPLKD